MHSWTWFSWYTCEPDKFLAKSEPQVVVGSTCMSRDLSCLILPPASEKSFRSFQNLEVAPALGFLERISVFGRVFAGIFGGPLREDILMGTVV